MGPVNEPQQGFAIGVDLGTSNTVAVIRWPDGRTRPLLVDGAPIMPSGVFVDESGRLHVGRDAARLAGLDPSRFEPNPKRRIDEPTVLLGDRELPTVDLLASILASVARAAVEAVGFLPTAVLTYPAAWGTRRRETLQTAARRAGWPPVMLVPEPVAAARYFADVLRRPVPVGSALAVFDFGGGTLDIAVVRNDGGRFEVIGTGGLEDLGGLDVDAALVEHLGLVIEQTAPSTWAALRNPATTSQRRDRRLFWDDVRGAKEMLSRATVAPITVPGHDQAIHLTREELDKVIEPLIRRAVWETGAVVQRSGLRADQLAGMFLVGGSSRLPLAARLLHADLGIPPTVLEQPELPVAEGALAELAPVSGYSTESIPAGTSRPMAAAPVSPGFAGAPTSAPAFGNASPPTGYPMSAGQAIPPQISAPPASGPPTSAPPTPPTQGFGAPPTQGFAAPPTSAPPTQGFGAPPVSGAPTSPPYSGRPTPPPYVNPPTPPSSGESGKPRRTGLLVAVAAALVVLVVLGGGYWFFFRDRDTTVEFTTISNIGSIDLGEATKVSGVTTATIGERVYVGWEADSKYRVAAYSLTDKKKAWGPVDIDSKNTTWRMWPFSKGILVAGTGDSAGGRLYLLSQENGKQLRQEAYEAEDRVYPLENVWVQHSNKDKKSNAFGWNGDPKWTRNDAKDGSLLVGELLPGDLRGPANLGGGPQNVELKGRDTIISVDGDDKIRVLDAANGSKVLHEYTSESDYYGIYVAYNGKLIQTSSSAKFNIKVFDLSKAGEPTQIYSSSDANRRIKALSPCGADRICILDGADSYGKDYVVRAISIADRKQVWQADARETDTLVPVGKQILATAAGSSSKLSSYLFDDAGKQLLSSDDQKSLGVRVAGGSLLFLDKLPSTSSDVDLALVGVTASSGDRVAVGTVKGTSCSWNAAFIACEAEGKLQVWIFAK
ncbi:Hsp70 family protein [Dactylosporangium sp. AC04546]|uniref:Hsp70 family protein n=1 Tax=Dactylosporangium sp. AC04546 TaxID=2862460 RepID=UPI001EDE2D77|nr:Hsp70 family protein [Dactylosporangium sp. AC04546]WVK84180.1 Hsp70 family protein [Dactylosporangium sp. AC04546]